MTGKTNKIREAAAAIALTSVLAALAVPAAWANGNDGDRATSKPVAVVNPDGMGSLGDRATSGPVVVVNPDGTGSLGDRATSKPLGSVPPAAPAVRIAVPSGFDLEAFGIGAVAMLGVIALLFAGGTRFRAIRRHGLHGV